MLPLVAHGTHVFSNGKDVELDMLDSMLLPSDNASCGYDAFKYLHGITDSIKDFATKVGRFSS